MWTVVYLPEAEEERDGLSEVERVALYRAVAQQDPRGFTRACRAAERRLEEVEE